MVRLSRLGTCLAVAALSAGPAFAAGLQPARAPVVQAVVDCRKVEAPADRLACYDKAVDGMVQAETKGDLVTIDREQRTAVRRQAFGLTLPSFAIFDRGEKPEEIDRLTAKVAEAHKNLEGKWVIKLEDGAVWRQIDSDNDLLHAPHAGSSVEIKRGAIGSFFLKVDGQSAMRAHRDN